ncbi:hypothetical protein QOT17_013257 [Balamuthia mandrillaris]
MILGPQFVVYKRYLALKIGRDLVIISKTFIFGWIMALDTFEQARPFVILLPNLLRMLVLHSKSIKALKDWTKESNADGTGTNEQC